MKQLVIIVMTILLVQVNGTRMMCEQMEVPDEYNRTLPEVYRYKVADLLIR